ncbi:MAG: DUF423 domain-containing protein [Acidobacteria bacterium]|nr:MAG: DUF423 domain-containing protein [Acidobacteriota bacterium]
MERLFISTGALFGFLAVAGGAFGSHALKNRLSPDMLQVFEVGVRYQMYHALALVLTGFILTRFQSPALTWAGAFFIAGVLIFSGTLYILTLTGLRWLGAITPMGGTALLIGWLCLAWGAWSAGQR